MTSTLSEREQRELEYLTRRSLLILDFVVEHSGEPIASAPAIRDAIEQVRRSGNLRGMRIIRSDLLDMSRSLRGEDRGALEKIQTAQAPHDPFFADGT